MSENKKNRNIVSMIVAAIIAFSLIIYFFSFQVRVNERAVVTTFGKPTESITEPGLYWQWPYPFQNVYVYDAREHTFIGKLEQVLTSDHKSVILQTYVSWRIEDPKKFLIRVGKLSKAPEDLEGLIRTYTSSVVSKHLFSHLISERENNDNKETEDYFATIENQIKKFINSGEGGTRENLGIEIVEFGIRTLKLPKKTTEKVFARMKADQNRIAARLISEGESEYEKLVSKADSDSEQKLIDAKAEAKKSRGDANAKAAEHYKEFASNVELAIWLRKLEALEKLLTKKTTLLLDPSTPPFDLLINVYPAVRKKIQPADKSDNQDGQKEGQ